jgi:hypothetical protein
MITLARLATATLALAIMLIAARAQTQAQFTQHTHSQRNALQAGHHYSPEGWR